jgi:putative proteasome-type protease
MTYCVGILLEQGLVLASDTRTNAGVDQVAVTPKMHVFEQADERVIILLTAGNLAITQSVVNILTEQLREPTEDSDLYNVHSMFEAARVVGKAMRDVHDRDGESLKEHGIEFTASILVAGQIKGEKPRLFNVYAAGNFIEATPDTPYLQIGETKYGKPILDRVVNYNTDIMEAVKCALISFDSTIRSNISVGLPLDLMIYSTGSFNADCRQRINEQDPYYANIRKGWGEGLRNVFSSLPNPDWSAS